MTEALNEMQFQDLMDRCDHATAKALLIKKYGGGVLPRKLAGLLDAYIGTPSAATARALVDFDPDEFVQLFKLSGQEGLQGRVNPRNAAMLSQEPEFQDYCDTMGDFPDRSRHNEIKAKLLAKGYTQEMLTTAMSEYFSG
jgi:hypothetical protein